VYTGVILPNLGVNTNDRLQAILQKIDTVIGATTSASLATLTDVLLTSPINGQVLTYNSTASKWENTTIPASITLTTIGTSGPATLLSSVLNIPNYSAALTGYLPLSAGPSFPLAGNLYLGGWSINNVNVVNALQIQAEDTIVGVNNFIPNKFSLIWYQSTDELVTDIVSPIHAVLRYRAQTSGLASNGATNVVTLSELSIESANAYNFDVDFVNIEARLTINYADQGITFGNYRAINIKSPIRNNFTAGGYINTYTALYIESAQNINVDGYRRAIYQEGLNDRNDFYGQMHLYNSLESTDPLATSSFQGYVSVAQSVASNAFIKYGALATDILAGDGSVITAGTNITISGGVISSTGGGGFSSANYIVDEIPSGIINGVNDTFTLAHTPITNKQMIFVNGVKMEAGVSSDYTISGANIIFNTGAIPELTDKLSATYIF
jgi:hypothetical protein